MDLESFLKKKQISQYKFANEIGLPPQYINQYVNKKITPRLDISKKIFFATNGKVVPDIVFKINEWKKELKELKINRFNNQR